MHLLLNHHPRKALQVVWVFAGVRVKRYMFLGRFCERVLTGRCVELSLGCESLVMNAKREVMDKSASSWGPVQLSLGYDGENDWVRGVGKAEGDWVKDVNAKRENKIECVKELDRRIDWVEERDKNEWIKDLPEGVRSWEDKGRRGCGVGSGYLLPGEISGDLDLRERRRNRMGKGRKEDTLVTPERGMRKTEEIEEIEIEKLSKEEIKLQLNQRQRLTAWRNKREEEIQKGNKMEQEMEGRNESDKETHEANNREQRNKRECTTKRENVKLENQHGDRTHEDKDTEIKTQRDIETQIIRHRNSHTNTTLTNPVSTTHLLLSNPDIEPPILDSILDDPEHHDHGKYSGGETTSSEAEDESDESEDEEDEWLSLIGPRGEKKWVRCHKDARKWIRVFEYAIKLIMVVLVFLWAKCCWPGKLTWR